MKKLLINGKELEHVGPIEWADDLDSNANTISFNADVQIEIGSKFALMDGKETVLTGIIATYTQNEPNLFQYGGYDFGFYLNKNSIIRQFNGMKISDAFNSLCQEYKIPVGTIPPLNATVKKIYKNAVLSDVFREFLELAEKKLKADYYYFTCADGKFNIKKYTVNEDLNGFVGDVFSIASTDSLMSPSITVSMEDLRNQVIVTDNASDKITKKVLVKNSASISKYGLLQHIEQIDTDKNNNLSGVANNKISELNKLKTTIDITMFGNKDMHKGVIMPVNNADLSLSGDYLIKSSRHVIDGTKEVVTTNLIKYDRNKIK